jgi:hypothetical protein
VLIRHERLGGPLNRALHRWGSQKLSGSCQLSGTVRFDPPMTTTPQSGSVDASANGTCTGTLTGAGGRARRVSAAPTQLAAQSHGTEACELGHGTGVGQTTIHGRRIDFTYSELRAGPALILTARGARGGSAVTEANVSPSANPGRDPASLPLRRARPGSHRHPPLNCAGDLGLTEARN